MSEFATFRWKSTGVVDTLPIEYATHPVFGNDLEPYSYGDEEYEEDKVVLSHEVPVDKRGKTVATDKKES
jgi:hypothetical protein